MQTIEEVSSMWLYDSVTEIDLKINKAIHKAKRAIMSYHSPASLVEKVKINAAGQEAIAADLLAEKVFLKTLIDEGISGTMYSEESGVKKFGHPTEDDPRSIVCIIDPLDGSANYAKGIPFGCISLAYGSYQSDPTLGDLTKGTIMSLYTNDEFYAEIGQGAYKNGDPLPQSSDLDFSTFEDRTIQMSYYAYGSKASKYYFAFEDRYSIRSLGSAAWELALVADNRNDAFVDIRGVLKTHDFAAAKLILEEVGGTVTFFDLSPDEVDQLPLDDFTSGHSIMATINPEFRDTLLTEFRNQDIITTSPSELK